MNKNEVEYMMKNWHKYKRTDTKEEFFELLNILDANNEDLKSMKNYIGARYEIYCGIVGSWGDLKDITNALFDFHIFYKTYEDFKEVCKMRYIEDNYKDIYDSFDEYLKSEEADLIKTFGGYVLKLHY